MHKKLFSEKPKGLLKSLKVVKQRIMSVANLFPGGKMQVEFSGNELWTLWYSRVEFVGNVKVTLECTVTAEEATDEDFKKYGNRK